MGVLQHAARHLSQVQWWQPASETLCAGISSATIYGCVVPVCVANPSSSSAALCKHSQSLLCCSVLQPLPCRNLFFPPQNEAPAAAAATPNLSPKELGKQRLQMILVADRCGQELAIKRLFSCAMLPPDSSACTSMDEVPLKP
jgi:hypothetical protein